MSFPERFCGMAAQGGKRGWKRRKKKDQGSLEESFIGE